MTMTSTTANSSTYYTGTITGTSTSTATGSNIIMTGSCGTGGGTVQLVYDDTANWQYSQPNVRLEEGQEYKLPDGSKLKIDDNGNFTIDDKDAKVTYKSNNIKEFNKFINASDLLEMFIKDCGKLGAKQGQILEIPIELFINWLILNAAKADGDEPPDDVLALPEAIERHPRCKRCGRYTHRYKDANGIHFCNGVCTDKFIEKKRREI
jgi:hypothetical protein